MDETSRRPGGLTALAVLNFVFGGFGALGLLFWLAVLGVAQMRTDVTSQLRGAAQWLLWVMFLVNVANVILLIASGVGYLRMKRFGRTLGTVYGILSLVYTGVVLASLEMPFGFQHMIGLVYPLLTLILVNTTFAGDLVN
jgi:hypothetical protein